MTIRLYSVSEVEIEAAIDGSKIQSIGGGVYPRLCLGIELNVKGDSFPVTDARYSIYLGTVIAELVVGNEKISDSLPKSLDRLCYNYDFCENLYLEFPLDLRRVEWLERQRQGITISALIRLRISILTLGVQRGASDEPKPPVAFRDAAYVNGDVPFDIPEAHWREKVLPGLGYGKVMTIELPVISMESCKALEHSFKALEKAQRHFSYGMYDDAVGACRVALEQFFEPMDKGDGSGKIIPKLKKSWESQLGKASYEWLDASLSAIKDAANKPHHSPNEHFDRLGAQMLLTVTTALISYAAQQASSNAVA